jgi:acetyltransferase-like isoleucine patch superfamily enzyme
LEILKRYIVLIKVLSFFLQRISKVLDKTRNFIQIAYLRVKYRSCSIAFNNHIEKGCTIRCTKGSKLKITNSSISSGTLIVADHGAEISIKDTFIGRNCVIVGREKITIASHCQIAEMVVIRDQNHNFGIPNKTIEVQGFTTKPIVIEENVWLAAKVTVVAGSKIGKNTVVGANAVVRGTLEDNSIYAGVPVRKIRSF